jgi:methionyl-tRNA formyltransferase
MDAGMDTGPIVAVARLALDGSEDRPGLEARLSGVAAALLRRVLAGWLAGELAETPQPADGVSVTRPLRREDGRLDPALPAAALERAVRAYRPWPGTFIQTSDGRLVIVAADVASGEAGDVAGTLVSVEGSPALATAAGRLRLLVVRPAGGRDMDGAAYLRGRPGLAGTRVG